MTFLKTVQIIIAILLTVSILLQNKGAGLGNMFGGSNNVYLSKRGFDKTLFIATVTLTVTFFVISLSIVLF